MDTIGTASTPRPESRLLWLVAGVAIAAGLLRMAPAAISGLIRAGIRLAFQLAILGLVLGYVSRFWPF